MEVDQKKKLKLKRIQTEEDVEEEVDGRIYSYENLIEIQKIPVKVDLSVHTAVNYKNQLIIFGG